MISLEVRKTLNPITGEPRFYVRRAGADYSLLIEDEMVIKTLERIEAAVDRMHRLVDEGNHCVED